MYPKFCNGYVSMAQPNLLPDCQRFHYQCTLKLDRYGLLFQDCLIRCTNQLCYLTCAEKLAVPVQDKITGIRPAVLTCGYIAFLGRCSHAATSTHSPDDFAMFIQASCVDIMLAAIPVTSIQSSLP